LDPKKWTPLSVDQQLLYVRKASDLQLPGQALPTCGQTDGYEAGLYVTYDPKTIAPHFGTTMVCWEPERKRYVHSMTTQAYSCGSIMLRDGKVCGIHHETRGPDSSGSNNFLVPLF
jgi:hypothetical protein